MQRSSSVFVGAVLFPQMEEGVREVAVIGGRETISRWLAERREDPQTSFMEDEGYEVVVVHRVLRSGRLARRPESLDSF